MRRSVRNRLAELLLRAFVDQRKGNTILWLRLFCDLARRANRSQIPLADLLASGKAMLPSWESGDEDALAWLTGAGELFRVRRVDTGEELRVGSPVPAGNVPWMVELEPEAHSALAEVRERARTYAGLLTSLHEGCADSDAADPLRRVVAQAAACFNAGLFFEAHEHLEQFWRSQPKGSTKRFLQGIIQLSVGCHHAQRGSYDGAVNQLAKGLEKTAGVVGEVLGVDCDAFLPAVARMREAIMAQGRGAMRPIPLDEIPHMPVSGMQEGGRTMKAKSPLAEPGR